VANNNPAKAELVKGGSLGISIKGKRKPRKGRKKKIEAEPEQKQSKKTREIIHSKKRR
jgi:hypothetical protein